MRQSAKRTQGGSMTCPNGLPALDDHKLAHMVSELLLPAEDHQRALSLLAGLTPGKFGLLARKDRDWLMQTASKANALPRLPKRPKDNGAPMEGDNYSARVTKGAEFGAAVVAWQVPLLGGVMPSPPTRR